MILEEISFWSEHSSLALSPDFCIESFFSLSLSLRICFSCHGQVNCPDPNSWIDCSGFFGFIWVPGNYAVFSLTLVQVPVASSSYRWVSDFLKYSPGLATHILVEKQNKRKILLVFQKLFPKEAIS